jgi:hypothetical protein
LSQLSVRLIEEGLERAWIDWKKNLTLADERTFLVRLSNDVARDRRLNLRVEVAVERGDPVAVTGNVFLNDARDFHFGARNGTRRFRTPATVEGGCGHRDKKQSGSSEGLRRDDIRG